MRSAARLYRLNLALAVASGAVVVVGLAQALNRLQLTLPSIDAIASACRSVVPLQSSLALWSATIVTVLGLIVLIRAFCSAGRQLIAGHRCLAGLSRAREISIGGESVSVIHDGRVLAFCAGLLTPRIYLSQTALERLNHAELCAVIAHEAHHRRRRDPLRFLVARVLADALFFMPGIHRLNDRYRELAEVAADETAAGSVGRARLASALLRLGENGARDAGAATIAPERVDHLLGQAPAWRLSGQVIGRYLAALAVLASLTVVFPTIGEQGSLNLTALLAQACMVGMFVASAAMAMAALGFSYGRLQRIRG